jgi:branched-chain amino acid transport system ATP-binding protein
MILIEDLTVRFGGVVSLDAVRAELPVGTVGLIGPNGAGKTTLLNVLSGFVRPTAGRVVAFGEDLSGMPAHTRARWGVRRTFQTEQAIGALSVAENVAMVHEHCGSGRRDRRAAVDRALEFTGLTGQRDRPVAGLSAADRRCVELARAVVGRPRVVLLDEPAAGLPEAETARMRDAIREIPEQFGALTILVDHDMALVSACCARAVVLDFGRVIASGPTAEVLQDDHVRRAYLGTEEVA